MSGWIDPTLKDAIEYTGDWANVQIKEGEVADVVAIVEGSNDEEAWFWLCKLNTLAPYALLVGWCDYTGFDCQGMIMVHLAETATEALAWLGHELGDEIQNDFLGTQIDKYDIAEAHADLSEQIRSGIRKGTWREDKAKELDLEPVGQLSVVRGG